MNGSHVRYVMYEIHYAILCLFSVNVYVMIKHLHHNYIQSLSTYKKSRSNQNGGRGVREREERV